MRPGRHHPGSLALGTAWRVRPGRAQQALLPVRLALHERLLAGRASSWERLRAICHDRLSHWDALWTFTRGEGVEPTNNAAERALRPAVVWRKTCFGTQSARGSRFIERLFSVAATAR